MLTSSSINPVFIVLTCVALLTTTTTDHVSASLLNVGDSGTFGHWNDWDAQASAQGLDSTDDFHSSRFTALENVTVDAVWNVFRLVNLPGNIARVSLYADDGNGLPNTSLPAFATGTTTLATGSGFTPNRTAFDNSANLVAGNVYHLVTEIDNFVTGEGVIGLARSTQAQPNRPFDRAPDPNFNSLSLSNSSDWTNASVAPENPAFAFENNGVAVAGPGNPFEGQRSNRFNARGGTGQSNGQLFTITDQIIPAGTAFEVDSVTVNITNDGSANDLLVELRELGPNPTTPGTVLATATFADDAIGVVTSAFDTSVVLDEGVSYLLTLRVDSTNSGDRFRFMGQVAFDGGALPDGSPLLGPATTGGDANSAALDYPILSTAVDPGTGEWTTYVPAPAREASELHFRLNGTVVPEPGSVLLMGLAGLALLSAVLSRD